MAKSEHIYQRSTLLFFVIIGRVSFEITQHTALQTINYAYNIRSWLTNINDVSALGEGILN